MSNPIKGDTVAKSDRRTFVVSIVDEQLPEATGGGGCCGGGGGGGGVRGPPPVGQGEEVIRKQQQQGKRQQHGQQQQDKVLVLIGGCGLWQTRLVVALALCPFLCAWHTLVVNFYTPRTEFYCTPLIPSEAAKKWSKIDWESWENISSPVVIEKSGQRRLHDKCQVFDLDYSQMSLNQTSHEVNSSKPLVPCHFWTHEKSISLSSEFDLVCDSAVYAPMSQSAFFLGLLCGGFLLVSMADRIGRKRSLIFFALCFFVLGIVTASSRNIWAFSLFRFFSAAFTAALCDLAHTYCTEILSDQWRSHYRLGHAFAWSLGLVTLPMLAHFLPNWTHLQLAITAPAGLLILLGFVLPESPRWLLGIGHLKDAEKILSKAAVANGRKGREDGTLLELEEEEAAMIGTNFVDLLKTPHLRNRTFLLFALWMTLSLAYFGLSLNLDRLLPDGLGVHLTMLVLALSEVASNSLAGLILFRHKRRISMYTLFVVALLVFGVSMPVPEGLAMLSVATIGRICVAAAYLVVLPHYAEEIFPSVVRTVGHRCGRHWGRLAAALAPFVAGSGAGVVHRFGSTIASFVLFGMLAVAGALMVLWMPETWQKDLPATLQEGEQFGQNDNILLDVCCRRKPRQHNIR